MDLIESLDHTFQHAHGVIGNVRPDQYDNTTPCEEWTVRDLLEHACIGSSPAVAQRRAEHRAARSNSVLIRQHNLIK